MSEPSLARLLVAAIDELLAFVANWYSEPGEPYLLTEDERNSLSELEGKVVGLLAVVSDGRIPFIRMNHPLRTFATGLWLGDPTKDKIVSKDQLWENQMLALRAAVRAIADAEASPTPVAALPTDETEATNQTRLTERQREALQALLLLRAFDERSRKPTRVIAMRAAGGQVAAESFKLPVADLHRAGLVDVKEGRGGGCWLTDKGRKIAEEIAKR